MNISTAVYLTFCKLRLFDVMRTSKDVDRGWSWVVALSLFSIYALSYGFVWITGLNRAGN